MKNIDIKINKDIEICIIGRLIWYKYWYKYGFGFKNGYNMILSCYINIHIYTYIILIYNYECKGNNNDMTDFEMNFLLS